MARDNHDQHVSLVTDAQPPHSADLAHRTNQYFISMGVRTVCVGLAIFVFTGWARWVCIAAAIALPYIAVVLANSGPLRRPEQPSFVRLERQEITGRADTETPSQDDAANPHR